MSREHDVVTLSGAEYDALLSEAEDAARLREELAALRAAPPAPVADGWVMVSKDEMTVAMMDAGQAYLDGKSLNGRFRLPGSFNWHEFWRAMLAAAPTEAGR